jgi:hypothetical protein
MAALLALTKWAFGLLKQKWQQFAFCAATSTCLFIILSTVVLSLAYLEPRPSFKAFIRMASTGGTINLNVNTPVLLVISVANVGNMQSTVDGWQLVADVNGHKYDGTAVMLPPETRVSVSSRAGTTFHFPPGGSLYSKGLESIAPGEMVTGFMIFQFPQLQPDTFSGPSPMLYLRFFDILERAYIVKIGTDQLNGTVPYFPGILELGS